MGPGTLRGASAEAMADLSQRLGKPATLDEAATIGDELFAVTRLLRDDPALRRVATDASLPAEGSRAWRGRSSRARSGTPR
jgi:F-type H+-transporting ATPase subunit delta